MTNQSTRRHQEICLPVGLAADGKFISVVVGYLLETNWGDGRKSYDVELFTTHLQPVLYQQERGVMPNAATVVCDKKDFSKRYKVSMPVKAPTEPGEETENEEA